jgi:putative PIN family toxin of toxin-antitoxin system
VLVAAFISRAGACGSLLEDVLNAAQIVEPVQIPRESCRDPNDLPILGAAVAARADVLITVDKDLLEIKAYEEIAIIKPGEFWKRIESAGSSL